MQINRVWWRQEEDTEGLNGLAEPVRTFDLSYHLPLLGKPHLARGCHFFLLHHTQVALTHPCHFRMQTGSATPHHSVIKMVGYLMLGPGMGLSLSFLSSPAG